MTVPSEIIQLKIRLLGISPMVWRRVLVPLTTTMRELHGVLQLTMGWEGIHLFQFDIRAVQYGSFELFAENPDIPLNKFGFRMGDRFSYVYDMGDHWEHEIRVEDFQHTQPRKTYPLCTGGSGVCPPEDCGGYQGYLERKDEAKGYDAWMDLDIMSGFARELVETHDAGKKVSDFLTEEVEAVMERMKSREPFLEGRFSRRTVNQGFREGRHLQLMRQQIM
jgi:hypothetical protein